MGSNPVVVNADSVTFYWLLTSFSADVQSAESGFYNSVKNFFNQLFDNLKNFFNSLFEWLREIRDNAVKLGQDIGNWFNQLGDKIKSFFTDIGDRIGDFFTTLWNRIWWGNEKGESEYEKPVINNKLNDILDTLDDYQIQLKGTIDTIGTASDSVSTYISTGTELVNGIIGVAGAGFTALIVFGIVFVLVRKVVGR